MDVFRAKDFADLITFKHDEGQLAVLERQPLKGGDEFFQKLAGIPLNVIGMISKPTGREDILSLLEDEITEDLKSTPFYIEWVKDLADVCNVFCDILESRNIGFCLATQRACQRYHVDNVPLRLLVTYHGQGTEWIPDSAVDRMAYESGMPNEKILLNREEREFLNAWDVAIFRGGKNGLLHRTPDIALDSPSILLRLDHETFWNNVFKNSESTTDQESV